METKPTIYYEKQNRHAAVSLMVYTLKENAIEKYQYLPESKYWRLFTLQPNEPIGYHGGGADWRVIVPAHEEVVSTSAATGSSLRGAKVEDLIPIQEVVYRQIIGFADPLKDTNRWPVSLDLYKCTSRCTLHNDSIFQKIACTVDGAPGDRDQYNKELLAVFNPPLPIDAAVVTIDCAYLTKLTINERAFAYRTRGYSVPGVRLPGDADESRMKMLEFASDDAIL